jgi:hypothetical protein
MINNKNNWLVLIMLKSITFIKTVSYITVGHIVFSFFISCIQLTDPENNNSYDEQNIIVYLVKDEKKPAGTYYLSWNQKDKKSNLISDGRYEVQLISKSNIISDYFEVSTDFPHISFPHIIDSTNISVLPTIYSISVNSIQYSIGDTLLITYTIPMTDSIDIDIIESE